MAKSIRNNTGIGIAGCLCIVFAALKVGGVIDWSWWWVLSPFWIPATLFLGVVFVATTIFGSRTK